MTNPSAGWQPWTHDDSKDLDQRVRALRKAEKRERSAAAMAKADAIAARARRIQNDEQKEDD
jgi:hypothetical protein